MLSMMRLWKIQLQQLLVVAQHDRNSLIFLFFSTYFHLEEFGHLGSLGLLYFMLFLASEIMQLKKPKNQLQTAQNDGSISK